MKKLLSREPTPKMAEVGDLYLGHDAWKFMWDAAPSLPEAGEVEREVRMLSELQVGLTEFEKMVLGNAADLIAGLTSECEYWDDRFHKADERADKLQAEVAARSEDTGRLDWIMTQFVNWWPNRAAIDAAMKGERDGR